MKAQLKRFEPRSPATRLLPETSSAPRSAVAFPTERPRSDMMSVIPGAVPPQDAAFRKAAVLWAPVLSASASVVHLWGDDMSGGKCRDKRLRRLVQISLAAERRTDETRPSHFL